MNDHTILKEVKSKTFANGVVYLLETDDGFPLEVTDTFLPFYTKDAIGKKQNALKDTGLGSRSERWMIGVSTMSGCPIRCKFCATAGMRRSRLLTSQEIIAQVKFVIDKHENGNFLAKFAKEFKINYTRMGEPFLNETQVRKAINYFDNGITAPRPKDDRGFYTHHYISTIGIKGADYSWIKDNITLQFSVHAFNENYRDWLIPHGSKITLEEMGKIRTESNLKTTLNLTLARADHFDIDKLKRWFDPEHFFCKISPINENEVSKANGMGSGAISQINLV